MKFLELFSGSGDISREMSKRGHECVTVDYDPKKGSDICADVYGLSSDFLNGFDFIWASPDCTTYSLASHGKHRRAGAVAVSEYAKQCDANNARLLHTLIATGLPFIVENPRAHFRNMEFVKGLYRSTVYYSQYGAVYSKPTDFFSNRNLYGLFDETIKKTGVQLDWCKRPNDFLGRCSIPSKLIKDICDNIELLCEREKDNE